MGSGPSAGISGSASGVTSSPSTATTPNPVDAQVNAGVPFVVQLSPATGPVVKRADLQVSYLKSNGNTTTDRGLAAIFRLSDDGQLAADGLVESTNPILDYQAFAGSLTDSVESITKTFKAANGLVTWSNESFEGNACNFYRTPSGQADNAMIIARFRGPVNLAWERIFLSAVRKLFSARMIR
jgi:hypothetical protein